MVFLKKNEINEKCVIVETVHYRNRPGWLLSRVADPAIRYSAAGDFAEQFQSLQKRIVHGRRTS